MSFLEPSTFLSAKPYTAAVKARAASAFCIDSDGRSKKVRPYFRVLGIRILLFWEFYISGPPLHETPISTHSEKGHPKMAITTSHVSRNQCAKTFCRRICGAATAANAAPSLMRLPSDQKLLLHSSTSPQRLESGVGWHRLLA